MGIKFIEVLKSAQKTSAATLQTVSDSSGNGSKAQNQSTEFVNEVLNSSVFNSQNQTNPNTVQKNSNQTQEQILAKLKAAGVKTTRIHYDRGETDFAQYTAALSDELKQEIINSYDCEADYILQQELLGLFTGNNSMKNGNFAASCEKMGYKVSRKSVKTTYLTDWKSGRNSTYRTGHISVYTITDPKTGAEIKIADTNGNGAIEAEEVVANEFLTGISAQIDISNFKGAPVISGGTSGLTSGKGNFGELISLNKAKNEAEYTEDGRLKLNEKQYKILKEKLIKHFINEGCDEATASSKALTYLNGKCMISDEAKSVGNLEKIAQAIAA